MNQRSVRDLDPLGKRVLVRVDFNVPIKGGEVTDDTRIQRALPTIRYLLEHGACPILISHLGRPKGEPDPKYAMDPVAHRLEKLLEAPVLKLDAAVGPEVEEALTDWNGEGVARAVAKSEAKSIVGGGDSVAAVRKLGLEDYMSFISTGGDAIVFAYEPIWAIGTGDTASPEDAQDAIGQIRGLLEELGGEELAGAVRILYGGSVKPENVDDIMAQEDVDGGLVGGASLDVDTFARLVKGAAKGD